MTARIKGLPLRLGTSDGKARHSERSGGLKRSRHTLCATHHLAMSPHRHALLTIRNLTPRNTGRMFIHERDYSQENGFPRTAQASIREKNSDQRKVEEHLGHPPVVPGISPHLFCERKQFGVRTRSTVLCDNRRDLSLANPRSRRRIARIFPAHPDLISGESARNVRHN